MSVASSNVRGFTSPAPVRRADCSPYGMRSLLDQVYRFVFRRRFGKQSEQGHRPVQFDRHASEMVRHVLDPASPAGKRRRLTPHPDNEPTPVH